MKVNGRVAFLALKDTIEAELSAGAFAKRIHSKYKGQLGFSYTQFLRYMQQYELQNPLQQCHTSRRAKAGARLSSQVTRGRFPSPHRERGTG
jgi:Family of unknown function (DUF5338)